MTDKPMYMNGRGVIRRTHELTDATWATVEMKILGTSMAVAVPLIGAMLVFLPGGGTVSTAAVVIYILASIVAIVVGIRIGLPWNRAMRALKAHQLAMEAETAKRGHGWADGT